MLLRIFSILFGHYGFLFSIKLDISRTFYEFPAFTSYSYGLPSHILFALNLLAEGALSDPLAVCL